MATLEEMKAQPKTHPSYAKVYGDRKIADKKDESKRPNPHRNNPFIAWDNEGSIIPCQNCDAPLTPEQARHGTLFCSEKCQQTAKAIQRRLALFLTSSERPSFSEITDAVVSVEHLPLR